MTCTTCATGPSAPISGPSRNPRGWSCGGTMLIELRAGKPPRPAWLEEIVRVIGRQHDVRIGSGAQEPAALVVDCGGGAGAKELPRLTLRIGGRAFPSDP